MKWMFKVNTDHISEFEITSSNGHQISFKYSRLQRSIRMKSGEHHGVFLLDKHLFANRKFVFRNVYGSEIGIVQKSLLHEHSGALLVHEPHLNFNFKLHPKEQLISIQSFNLSFTCSFETLYDKAHEEIYMLALLVLSWAYSVATPVEVKALAETQPMA